MFATDRSLAIPVLAALTLAGIATPALAQEAAPPVYSEDQRDAAPFNGLYIGAAGGFDAQPNDVGSSILFDRNLDGRFGDTVTTAAGANAFSPGFCNGRALGATRTPAGCRNDKDGAAYYGRVGIDQQRGPIVFGIVGEFGKSEIDDSVSAYSTTPASYTMRRSIGWEASGRGRLGFAANRTLFYGTAGVGYARIDRDFFTTNTANAFTGRGRRNQFGLTAGGGIEQKISRHISIGLEYMYHQYGDDDYRVRATAGSAPATNPFILAPNTTGTDFRRSDQDFRWHSMRGTVAFRF